MNRAEKRRQRKLAEKASKKARPGQETIPSPEQQTLIIQQSLALAVQHHNEGRLPEAESILQQILQVDPNQPVALHLLGLIAHQAGKNDTAVDLITKALTIQPDYAEAHGNLGNMFKELGKLDEAVASYQKALAIKPDNAGAHYNLGLALQELGQFNEAVDHYRKVTDINPDHAEAHNNIGNAFNDLGCLDEAVASYHKALAANPDYAEAHCNLGTVLQLLGRKNEAVAHYHKALAIKPDLPEAHINFAIALNKCGHRSEALDLFKSGLELVRGDNPIDPMHKSFQFITKVKMNHDIEQFRYLASLGHETEHFQAFAKIYESVDEEIDWPNDDRISIPLSDDHRQRLSDTYNRPIHLLEAPEVIGSTLCGSLDVEKITADYFAHTSGMTYFDDLLSPVALASLHRFLLGSTIWFDFSKGGYLCARMREGFSCPLIFQIADDLRQTFPDIFKDHQLNQLWAYKYDSSHTGIGVHADSAAINVNFWITPDTANLNPASGGIVVHDFEAPIDWTFKVYNPGSANSKHVRKYLADQDSGKIVVPYGENRIVLFNSNLFHETDSIYFKPGYENRRINVTMLFGRREG